jgi:endoglucanase
MTTRPKRAARRLLLATAALALTALAASAGTPLAGELRSGDRFFVEPDTNALRQAEIWAAQGRAEDAALMRALAAQPQAIWFTSGTPDEVNRAVHQTVFAAGRQKAVAVLVAYYIPGRDCSQYSAGGAPSEAAYNAWIDAFARGIGGHEAIVILEPDGLALLSSEPWCGEGGGGFTGTAEDFGRVDERFRELNAALDRLGRLPRTAVYIDAGHSNWQPLNDYDAGYGEPRLQLGMANRLLLGGIAKADGFFLNVSNYRSTSELIAYGTRLSKCLSFRERTGAASCSDADIAAEPDKPGKQTHFILDTSRNGQGHWTPPAGFPDPQDWCNPPGRGLGARPTTITQNALVDALLWVKRPGESDGSCTRGLPGPEDPVYGQVDPPAGAWWPEYALGLAQRANPPLN